KVAVQNILIKPSLFWLPSGLPFLKLGETKFCKDFPIKGFSGMKAGLLRNWRKRLEESNRMRQKNGEHFIRLLGLNFEGTRSVPFLRLPVITRNKEERDLMYAVSRENGTGFSKMYPAPVNEIEEIREQFHGKTFPVAGAVAGRILTVPTHEFLTEKDGDRILHVFQEAGRCAAGDMPCPESRKKGVCHV
ncbi:MAG TPA: DegT/DnrJ/EryC1/StrS family aminotransferase, partial [Dissulfurispiraceae bacterium]|nr:DegT/DnrJ/EryC1/StrS family aminotransferase [Dissulfurispiraceae bacterium]